MSLRPFGRNKVLVTDGNGKMVSQSDQSSADLVVDEVTAGTGFTGDLVGDVTGDVTGEVIGTGGITGPAPEVGIDDTIDVGTFPSGTVFVATKTSATQVYTLPTAAPGLRYTFICGHADGEIIIKPSAAGQGINGKGFAVTHSAGIENDAGSNAVGDAVTLVGVSATAWYAESVIGTWSTDAS
jgi:hypothetical protein